MRVLHIAAGFSQTPVYRNLAFSLQKIGIKQGIFAAVRTEKEARFDPPELRTIPTRVVRLLYPYDRVFFRNKIRKISHALEKRIDVDRSSIIHAHTLYSDGAVAFQLHRKYGTPFIVAVRNTDLNAFQRFRPDLKPLAKRILHAASGIILISPAYQEKMMHSFGSKMWSEIRDKTHVVPNGVDPFWIETADSLDSETTNNRTPRSLVFVGGFTKGKNIFRLLQAVGIVNRQRPTTLTLVGDGPLLESARRFADRQGYSFASFRGRVHEKEELKTILHQHDAFVMPSLRETFGLVYIEAMSQGLPVLCSRGEGIDGLFPPETVSEAVNPLSVTNMAHGINRLLERSESIAIREQCRRESQRFDWNLIAQDYIDLYSSITPST